MKKTFKKTLAVYMAAVVMLCCWVWLTPEKAEASTYSVGDIIEFGSYPQSEVTDEDTVLTLNSLVPEWEKWNSYGYYSGTGEYGSMTEGNWMRYIDVEYGGEKYRGVKFVQYRPSRTFYISSENNSHQDDNGYVADTVYWFMYEPIKWRILDTEDGLVMCETIIDAQPYSDMVYKNDEADSPFNFFNDSFCTKYANDYATSSIREWLNEKFYNSAFNEDEKELIKTSNLNNDGFFTLVGEPGYEAFDSNPTEDRIFLLSLMEVMNPDYGFIMNIADDKSRVAYGTDYAKSQGLYLYEDEIEFGTMWNLRTPGSYSHSSCDVLGGGGVYDVSSVFGSDRGVRPALKLTKLEVCPDFDESETTTEPSANPSTTEPTSSPTTTEPSTTEPTTTPSVTEPVTEPSTTQPAEKPEDNEGECSCMCHKTGFMGFIYKIVNFFWKLFGMNKTCSCGVAHY